MCNTANLKHIVSVFHIVSTLKRCQCTSFQVRKYETMLSMFSHRLDPNDVNSHRFKNETMWFIVWILSNPNDVNSHRFKNETMWYIVWILSNMKTMWFHIVSFHIVWLLPTPTRAWFIRKNRTSTISHAKNCYCSNFSCSDRNWRKSHAKKLLQ